MTKANDDKFSTSPEMVRRMRPDIREQMMARSAAARTYIDRCIRNGEQQQKSELAAFMSIFHPEVSDDRVRELMRGIE